MSYDKNSREKSDKITKDPDGYSKLDVTHEVENKLNNRDYDQRYNNWIHIKDIDDDEENENDKEAGLIDFVILGIALLTATSFFINY
jgi:hypothetical protein